VIASRAARKWLGLGAMTRSRWRLVVAIALLAPAAACEGLLGIEDVRLEDGGVDAAPVEAAPVDAWAPDAGPDSPVGPRDAAVDSTTSADSATDAPSGDAGPIDDACPAPPPAWDAGNTWAPPTDCTSCADGSICTRGECHPGSCFPGNQDCATDGGICVAWVCNPCSQDWQCAAEYPDSGRVCLNHACVASACDVAASACDDAGHVCCPSSGDSGALACVSGDCCGGEACVNHFEVADGCAPVQPNACGSIDYFVAADGGSDEGGTGSPSCPFQTITHALAYVGSPSLPTEISVLGGSTAPERRPMMIPRNVMILGPGVVIPLVWDKYNDVSVDLVLAYPSSGLAYFSLPSKTGVTATGSIDRSTVVHHVLWGGAAFGVASSGPNGGITLGPGFQGQDGTLDISAGSVLLLGGSAGDQTTLGTGVAADIGIKVHGWGSIDIEGGDGGVLASGVYIFQVPSDRPYPNTIRGLRSSTGPWAVQAPGIHVYGGSSLTLRDSWVTSCAGPGVEIDERPNSSTVPYVGAIDLGSDASPGNNTFQDNSGPNVAFEFVPSAPVQAVGNTFSEGSCAQAPAPQLSFRACAVDAGPDACSVDIALVVSDAGSVDAGAIVNVAACSLP
jgi:hypothetical protein